MHCMPSLGHGGAERQLSYLAGELIRKDHEVHICYLADGPQLERVKSNGVILHKLISRSNYDPYILLQLIRLIRQIRPNIIQSWMVQMDILGGLAAHITRTPWILRESSSGAAYPPNWKTRLRLSLVKGSRAIISNSAGGDLYWQAHLRGKPRYIIRNGVPLEELEEAAPYPHHELGLESTERIVLYVGRFEHYKNIENLLRAMALLQAEPHLVAVLCGDGPWRPNIDKLIKELGLSHRVLLPGFISTVWSLLKLAKVFISVGYFEGCPNTVLEAMAGGCPLVVSEIPAHRELLDEDIALFVNPLNPMEIANAIIRSLTAPEEAQGRARLAKAKVRQWSVPAMARCYEEVYQELLASTWKDGRDYH
jgi:glycosyltransferase involved in cell wall biosynthesis